MKVEAHGNVYLSDYPLGLTSPGTWVAVRLAGEDETFLGVVVGHIALSTNLDYNPVDDILKIRQCNYSPAMWVPDKKRLVFGCESWWVELKAPEDLRQIADTDIQNQWYVQALAALQGKSDG